jgi:hypothetical protein
MKKFLLIISMGITYLMPFSVFADVCLKNETPVYIHAYQGPADSVIMPGETIRFSPKHTAGGISLWYAMSSALNAGLIYWKTVMPLDGHMLTIKGRKKPRSIERQANACN